MKKKKVRRVVDKTYNNFLQSDFTSTQDNLNPVRHMDFANKIADLESAVDKEVDAAIDELVAVSKKRKSGMDDSLRIAISERGASLNDLASTLKAGSWNGVKYPQVGDQADWISNKIDRALAFAYLDNPDITDALRNFHIPVLDCTGVSNILDLIGDGDDDGGSGDGNNGDGNGNGPFAINYHIEHATNPTKNPIQFVAGFVPFKILKAVADDDYTFVGWYSDDAYTDRLTNGLYTDKSHTGDLDIYAKVKLTSELTDEDLAEMASDDNSDALASLLDGDPENTSGLDADAGAGGDDEAACILIELSFLKYVLIVIKIVKMIIKIMNIAIYLATTIAELVGKAGTCWNDPPIIADIVQDIVGRVLALVMSIITKLLAKIWAALNLDCVGTWTMDMVNQIMSAMAGITGSLKELNATAVNLGSTIKGMPTFEDIWDTLSDQVTEAGKKLENLPSAMWEDLKNAGNGTVDQLADFISPKNLLNAVPGEAKELVATMTAAVNNTIDTMKSVADSFKAFSALTGVEGASDPQVKSMRVVL